jgi:predicted HD phosphohydrolase
MQESGQEIGQESGQVFADARALIAHMSALGVLASSEGLAMSELDHGLQSAALVARAAPDDVELQVAALLHDLAHPWDEAGQPRHALMGADAVRPLLGERVARLIAGHVPAKRWLVTSDPDYRAALSAASIATLAAQGADMSAAERAWFEALPDWQAMVMLRRADDGAKVPGADVPGLDAWVDAIHQLAARHRS